MNVRRKKIRQLCATTCLVLLPTFAFSHDNTDHCEAVQASVEDAGFSNQVSVDCEDGHAIISSTTFPDHDMMTGIVGTNEQVPVPAKLYQAPIPLAPILTETPKTRDAALGIAVNGVPIYDYTGGGEMSVDDLYSHHPHDDTVLTEQLDVCGGHAGRGDDYHYHTKPTCMIDQMLNKGDDAIIGWAYDGYPIYGDNNPDGTDITELDVCNGQADETFGYRYHTSEDAPYIIQCLMGEVLNMKELPRVGPLRVLSGDISSDAGRPPQGGVEDLTVTTGDLGAWRMDYSYEGEDYYISYKNADAPNCYDFERRTITNNGEVQSGTMCR